MSLSAATTAVVILNYKGAEDTLACLQALRHPAEQSSRIIIVDNASGDDSVPRIRQWLEREAAGDFFVCSLDKTGETSLSGGERYVLLPLSENNGYAAGNNEGIRIALQDSACRAVWILNNDTEPEPGALQALCDRLNSLPRAGIAGSTLVYAHASDLVQCAGGYTFNRYLGTTAPFHGKESASVVKEMAPEHVEKQLGYISGASLLVRREVLERVGLLPEEYFLYYEDVDFSLGARNAGYTLAWAPGSVVRHKEGGTTGASSSRVPQRSEGMDYLSLRNRAWIIRKHFSPAVPVLCLSLLGVLANRARRAQWKRVPLVFRALRDGLAGRMGKPDNIEKRHG